MTIKTFRGQIANGGQDTIVLHTNDGSTGYRIVKFEIMTPNPGTQDFETIVKIYKVSQSTTDGAIDFNDNTLLAASTASGDATSNNYPTHITTIFDREIFNQDIYVTHASLLAPNPGCNYYIELEQVKLDINENTVATLKDIRNTARTAVT